MSPGRGTALLALLAALAWPGAAPARAEADGLPPVLEAPADGFRDGPAWRDLLVRLFADGTTRDERRVDGPLAKWAGPVEIVLAGPGAAPHLAFVEGLAADLAGLTGLPVRVSLDGRRGGLGAMDVFVAADPRWWPFGVRPVAVRAGVAPVFTCAAAPTVRAGVILHATVRVNAGVLAPASVRACLLEEIVQSLGLFGEVAGRDDTILGDRVGLERLGIVDRLLLRTLYDPRLPPGTSRALALPLAAAVLAEHAAHVACREDAVPRRCELP